MESTHQVKQSPVTCHIQDNGCDIGSGGFGFWYWINDIPMIKVNFGQINIYGCTDQNDFKL